MGPGGHRELGVTADGGALLHGGQDPAERTWGVPEPGGGREIGVRERTGRPGFGLFVSAPGRVTLGVVPSFPDGH